MRVHLITNLFAPDELAGAALFTDLALFLKERGHDMRVTCTFSYYPNWKLRPEDKGLALREEICQGIPVRRVRMYVPEHPTGKGRMLSDLSFLVSLVRRGRHPAWRPEVVLTALPMLSQCLAQRFLYRGKRIPRLIVVQDFVVEAALELGILRLPGCARLLHGLQRWALRSAQTLLTISPVMLEKLRAIVGPDRRTCYVPNWIHGSLQREIDRQSQTGQTRKQGTLFYAGNLGVKQGLPGFLGQFRAAGGADLGWQLEIHGGGAERGRIAREIDRTPGCRLGSVLEESDYVAGLRAASACVVTQRLGVGANFLPSKLLPALATATPVLAVCELASPLGQEVIEGGFGEVIMPGDHASLARTLRRWRTEPGLLHEMSIRAARRSGLYQRERILSVYEQELMTLVGIKAQNTFAAVDKRGMQDPVRAGIGQS
jgi:colanic acid biosynthesis glycosyl transferase WcaI